MPFRPPSSDRSREVRLSELDSVRKQLENQLNSISKTIVLLEKLPKPPAVKPHHIDPRRLPSVKNQNKVNFDRELFYSESSNHISEKFEVIDPSEISDSQSIVPVSASDIDSSHESEVSQRHPLLGIDRLIGKSPSLLHGLQTLRMVYRNESMPSIDGLPSLVYLLKVSRQTSYAEDRVFHGLLKIEKLFSNSVVTLNSSYSTTPETNYKWKVSKFGYSLYEKAWSKPPSGHIHIRQLLSTCSGMQNGNNYVNTIALAGIVGAGLRTSNNLMKGLLSRQATPAGVVKFRVGTYVRINRGEKNEIFKIDSSNRNSNNNNFEIGYTTTNLTRPPPTPPTFPAVMRSIPPPRVRYLRSQNTSDYVAVKKKRPRRKRTAAAADGFITAAPPREKTPSVSESDSDNFNRVRFITSLLPKRSYMSLLL